MFGLDGIEIGLLITVLCLFAGILSGFPVGFAIGGSAIIAFTIIALLDAGGFLIHQSIDTGSAAYAALLADGVTREAISVFTYPDLPRIAQPLFVGGWEQAINRNLSFIVNRMNERVIAGQSIETLLAVLMFVMMGITLERSKIAGDLLTTMARVFGPLPGGLAVSVVVVGAFLAASTGIVGATVVTMGLLSLPTMLRHNYSPQLATGVISASGTLGQIIPPSIIIVLLGTLAGDLYSTAQEERAKTVGCSDALTYLGEPAVVSVGTLFQAAILPGIFLAFLYAAYAFGYALLNPDKAPPVLLTDTTRKPVPYASVWFIWGPVALVAMTTLAIVSGWVGKQNQAAFNTQNTIYENALRTNVSEQCKEAMIDLHGQDKWDQSVAARAAAAAAAENNSNDQASDRQMSSESWPSVGLGMVSLVLPLALVLMLAVGMRPYPYGQNSTAREQNKLNVLAMLLPKSVRPLWIGAVGVIAAVLVDAALIVPESSSGFVFVMLAVPFALILYGVRTAVRYLAQNELLRVVFPPLILIVTVLGSILGGVTNPTPAAALGAAGAIMLAAYRQLTKQNQSGKIILIASFAVVIMLLVGVNFDMRIERENVLFQDWVALIIALAAYHIAVFGLLYACYVLYKPGVLTSVVRDTAKITSMVFTILIGSQMLNLVIISFGGEDYIQQFLRSFDNEIVVFLVVMILLFVLGFVLDFLEIIYIVIPIVGPIIYGGSLDPKWVTIMIAVNLQSSFLTPPFGFALFYLRGVAPPSISSIQIYRGVMPFLVIQIIGLALMWLFPQIVTFIPDYVFTNQ